MEILFKRFLMEIQKFFGVLQEPQAEKGIIRKESNLRLCLCVPKLRQMHRVVLMEMMAILKCKLLEASNRIATVGQQAKQRKKLII